MYRQSWRWLWWFEMAMIIGLIVLGFMIWSYRVQVVMEKVGVGLWEAVVICL